MKIFFPYFKIFHYRLLLVLIVATGCKFAGRPEADTGLKQVTDEKWYKYTHFFVSGKFSGFFDIAQQKWGWDENVSFGDRFGGKKSNQIFLLANKSMPLNSILYGNKRDFNLKEYDPKLEPIDFYLEKTKFIQSSEAGDFYPLSNPTFIDPDNLWDNQKAQHQMSHFDGKDVWMEFYEEWIGSTTISDKDAKIKFSDFGNAEFQAIGILRNELNYRDSANKLVPINGCLRIPELLDPELMIRSSGDTVAGASVSYFSKIMKTLKDRKRVDDSGYVSQIGVYEIFIWGKNMASNDGVNSLINLNIFDKNLYYYYTLLLKAGYGVEVRYRPAASGGLDFETLSGYEAVSIQALDIYNQSAAEIRRQTQQITTSSLETCEKTSDYLKRVGEKDGQDFLEDKTGQKNPHNGEKDEDFSLPESNESSGKN